MSSDASDPKKIGPGFWASWHIRTLNHTKPKDQKRNKEIIENDIYTFPCMKCRKHAMEYLIDHPIVIKGENELELFIWTVNMHNYVNQTLGKEYIDIEDAKKIWSGDNVCMEDCGEEGSIEIDVEKIDIPKREDFVYKVY